MPGRKSKCKSQKSKVTGACQLRVTWPPYELARTRLAAYRDVFRATLLAASSVSRPADPGRQQTLVIGSKNFTEQVILGEMLAQHLEAKTGLHVERRFYLAGTYICSSGAAGGAHRRLRGVYRHGAHRHSEAADGK